jgi:hypothetical protein
MGLLSGGYAGALRRELAARNREYARDRALAHVESYGDDPVVVYCPYHAEDGAAGNRQQATGNRKPRPASVAECPPRELERHGNFYTPAYEAIRSRPEWAKRLTKVHAQGRALPKWAEDPHRKWRELDSCMSSDALLMNVFCTPEVAPAVRPTVDLDWTPPEFGWKAKVPLKSGLFDRTEVDMRWGDLLVEAKLTESDFQTRRTEVVEAYRDFEEVFDRELLPRVEVLTGRRKKAEEFAEAYSQEWEDTGGLTADETQAIASQFQAELEAEAEDLAPREVRYEGYQLIRNVLAAHAVGARFCVICDERRPDLREVWFSVMRAVRTAEVRTRLQILTWQELAEELPEGLQEFLAVKYGIGSPGTGNGP